MDRALVDSVITSIEAHNPRHRLYKGMTMIHKSSDCLVFFDTGVYEKSRAFILFRYPNPPYPDLYHFGYFGFKPPFSFAKNRPTSSRLEGLVWAPGDEGVFLLEQRGDPGWIASLIEQHEKDRDEWTKHMSHERLHDEFVRSVLGTNEDYKLPPVPPRVLLRAVRHRFPGQIPPRYRQKVRESLRSVASRERSRPASLVENALYATLQGLQADGDLQGRVIDFLLEPKPRDRCITDALVLKILERVLSRHTKKQERH
jgi:hypothetical protein